MHYGHSILGATFLWAAILVLSFSFPPFLTSQDIALIPSSSLPVKAIDPSFSPPFSQQIGGRYQISENFPSLPSDRLGPDDEYWYNHITTDDAPAASFVFAVAISGSRIYIGGLFSHAGGKLVNNVACYDTVSGEWSVLGDKGEEGVNGSVYALATHDGKLYAGGVFTRAGNLPASSVAVWDEGTGEWSTMDGGVQGTGNIPSVNAIIVDEEGGIYVGGNFRRVGSTTVANLALWKQGSWRNVGGGTAGSIVSMAFAAGRLYVAGTFQSVGGGTPSSAVAMWDGNAWQSMGNIISPYGVADITVGPGGSLFVVGSFLATNALSDYLHALVWQNGEWQAVQGLSLYAGVRRLESVIYTSDQKLVVTGDFDSINGLPANRIAAWNGDEWEGLGDGLFYSSRSPTKPVIENYGADLVVGGYFSYAGQSHVNGIARWNGISWRGLGSGVSGGDNSLIKDVAVSPDNHLYLAGAFNNVGPVPAANVVEWSGEEWHELGSGVDDQVETMVIDKEGNLVIGGRFTQAGGISSPAIARWNGVRWDAMNNDLFLSVQKLRVIDGLLCASGTSLDGRGVVASYTGSQWKLIADPVDPLFLGGGNTYYTTIFDFAVVEGEGVYVCGDFISAADATVDINQIGFWNGSEWVNIGEGINRNNSLLQHMEVVGDNLMVGGSFNGASGLRRLNRTTGQWQEEPGFFSDGVPYITDMIGQRGRLFVSGRFSRIGSVSANNIAFWNGDQWEGLGSGVNAPAVLALGYFEDLFVAGADLASAGDKEVNTVARWTKGMLGVEMQNASHPNLSLSLLTIPVVDEGTFLLVLDHPAEVSIDLYSIEGQPILTIAKGYFQEGENLISWHPQNQQSGLYFYRMLSGEEVLTGRVLIVR